MRILLLSLTAAFLLTACGEVCSMKVTEYATLTNLTGTDIKVELCKVPYRQESGTTKEKINTRSTIGDYEIASNQDGSFLADEYASSYNKDKNKGCESASESPSYSSQVFLTPKSIAQVKLCRDDDEPTKVTLVRRTSACPAGSTSQVQAIASCDETALID